MSLAASTSVAIRASSNWTPWNSPIGLPELLALGRVGEGVVEGALGGTDHLGADPDAALVERLDRDLVALADLADDVLLGTRTSSRISSQVELARMPSLSSFLPTSKPSKSRSTMKLVIPL